MLLYRHRGRLKHAQPDAMAIYWVSSHTRLRADNVCHVLIWIGGQNDLLTHEQAPAISARSCFVPRGPNRLSFLCSHICPLKRPVCIRFQWSRHKCHCSENGDIELMMPLWSSRPNGLFVLIDALGALTPLSIINIDPKLNATREILSSLKRNYAFICGGEKRRCSSANNKQTFHLHKLCGSISGEERQPANGGKSLQMNHKNSNYGFRWLYKFDYLRSDTIDRILRLLFSHSARVGALCWGWFRDNSIMMPNGSRFIDGEPQHVDEPTVLCVWELFQNRNFQELFAICVMVQES